MASGFVSRMYRHPHAPLTAFLLIILLFAGVVWQLEQQQAQVVSNAEARVEAFCVTQFDTRVLFGQVLTTIAQDPDDTPADDARQRGLADRLEVQLRVLPDGCLDYVDPSAIRIHVDG